MKEEKYYLERIGKKSVVEQVVDQITEGIIQGNLKPGERIPTETELGEAFGVGRNSVREAIKKLVSVGVLEIRRAEGTFVRSGFSQDLINPLLYGIILQRDSAKDILEVRKIFEVGVLQAAINKATEEETKKVEHCLENLKQTLSKEGVDYTEVVKADEAFHKSIEEILGNPLILNISSCIGKIIHASRSKTIQKHVEAGEGQSLIMIHTEIFEVLKNRQSYLANEVIEKSYTYWEKSLGEY